MKTNFTFLHLDHSQALMDYTHGNLEEIARFLLKASSCNVLFSKTREEFCVEISVPTKERYFRAKAYASDIYVAVDMAVEKLERQFLKVRKVNQHHKKFELSKEGRMQVVNDRFELKSPRLKKAA